MLVWAQVSAGAFTAVNEAGVGRWPLVYLRMDSLAAGRGYEDVNNEVPPDDSFVFAFSPERARFIGEGLIEAARQTEKPRKT